MNTRNPALRIGLSCAIGAFLGTTIAVSMNPFLWWIGLLSGGLLSYIISDFRAILKAVPVAWEKAQQEVQTTQGKALLLLLTTIIVLMGSIVIQYQIAHYFQKIYGLESNVAFIFFMLMAWTALAFFLVLGNLSNFADGKDNELLISFLKFANFITIPIGVLKFIYIFYIPKDFKKAKKDFARGMHDLGIGFKTIGRFFKILFITIHSEARFICGVDACIGVGVGYYWHSPIVGAIVGSAFGIINYYIVSIKILKLKPKF